MDDTDTIFVENDEKIKTRNKDRNVSIAILIPDISETTADIEKFYMTKTILQ